jgi:hypothetical protein
MRRPLCLRRSCGGALSEAFVSGQISENPQQQDDWNWNSDQPEQYPLAHQGAPWLASNLAEQNQDQQDDDYQPEAAAAVVAGSVESTTPEPAEAAEQYDDQDDKQNGSDGHVIRLVSLLSA